MSESGSVVEIYVQGVSLEDAEDESDAGAFPIPEVKIEPGSLMDTMWQNASKGEHRSKVTVDEFWHADENDAEEVPKSSKVVTKTKVEFDSLVDVVRQIADQAAGKFDTLAKKPSQISLEFGLTIGVKGGVPVFAEMSGTGSIKVGLVWTSSS
jgi:hypothetical protein